MFASPRPIVPTRELVQWVEARRHLLSRADGLVWDLFRGAKGPSDLPRLDTLERPHELELAALARLHAFGGDREEALRCIERALATSDSVWVVLSACALFPASHGRRWSEAAHVAVDPLQDDPTHRVLATAEGYFAAGSYDDARELLRRAIALHLAPGTPAHPMFAVSASLRAAHRARRIQAGLLAVGAEETAEQILPARPTAADAMQAAMIAELAATARDPDRAARAHQRLVEALTAAAALAIDLLLTRMGYVVDVTLAHGAVDAARAHVALADRLALAAQGAQGDGVARMWRAIRSAKLAELHARVGDTQRANELLDADSAYPPRRRPAPRSGADATVSLVRADALIACGRWDEARDEAAQHGRFKVPALLVAAAGHAGGASLFEWAADLEEEVARAALSTLVGEMQRSLLPPVDQWGCLRSTLVPADRRSPARLEGSLPLGGGERAAPTSGPLAALSVQLFAGAQRPSAALAAAIRALEHDEGTGVDPLDTALWEASHGLPGLTGPLRLYVASRRLEWDVGNGGFSQAAFNALEDFEDAAAGYDAMGVPDAAALIRRALPLATREARFQRADGGPEEDARGTEAEITFEELDAALDAVGWWAEEARIAFVRAHRAEILAALRAASTEE